MQLGYSKVQNIEYYPIFIDILKKWVQNITDPQSTYWKVSKEYYYASNNIVKEWNLDRTKLKTINQQILQYFNARNFSFNKILPSTFLQFIFFYFVLRPTALHL